MNYDQTLAWLYQQLPAFSRIGAPAYKPGLGNTIALSEWLNEPEKKFKSIHVAGTNGKGSVSHMMAAVLQAAGYKVGLYTSPHLKDFRERIRINGKPCEQQFVVQFVERYRQANLTIEPSFFELTVAMAFNWFAQEKVDVAVVETGLGGRLDSTNIVQPLLSIITNIGWDHMNFLGDSLEAIAGEKAGIIKQQTPVVVSEWQAELADVFKTKALQENAPLVFAPDRWKAVLVRAEADGSWFEAKANDGRGMRIFCQLGAGYQGKNIAAVLAALDDLRSSFPVSETAVQKGLAEVKTLTGLRGRWDCLRRVPLTFADVAHNVPGMEELIKQIALTPHQRLHLVIGFVKDKQIDELLRLLPTNAHYYFTQASIERALPATDLAEKARQFQLIGTAFRDVNLALEAAWAAASNDDLVVVCGSIFLVGELDALHI